MGNLMMLLMGMIIQYLKGASILVGLVLICGNCFGQLRTLNGKVVDPNLDPVPNVLIQLSDSTIGKTDGDGLFAVGLPDTVSFFVVIGVAMERKVVRFPLSCDYLGIVLLHRGTYDFMGPAKVDRLRKKDFNRLPGLYQEAFKRGIFPNPEPCFLEKFEPMKKRLREIRRERRE